MLQDLLSRAGLSEEYQIESAATSSEEIGNPVYPPMRRVLEQRNYDCTGKTARRVIRSDYDQFDLIIGMDDENIWDLRRLFHGDPDGKLHTLLEFDDRPYEEIPDPWYTRDFAGCLDEIELACSGLMEALTGVVFLDFSSCADISDLYTELRRKMNWAGWYGENLDALHDILTGLPHRGNRFIITSPGKDAPAEVRLYAEKISSVFLESGKGELE